MSLPTILIVVFVALGVLWLLLSFGFGFRPWGELYHILRDDQGRWRAWFWIVLLVLLGLLIRALLRL